MSLTKVFKVQPTVVDPNILDRQDRQERTSKWVESATNQNHQDLNQIQGI